MSEPVFPPLMQGHGVSGATDPFETACLQATRGCDAGLIVHNLAADRMGAALVFAPEVPLAQAMAMLPVCELGLQNALGALAPPEVAVQLEWAGQLRINGARCGHFRAAAATGEPDQIPDWLVVGFEIPLVGTSEPASREDTVLFEEGCADIDPATLLESWARHTLNWIARWEGEGNAPVHAEWRGLAWAMGETVERNGRSGTFLGVDEDFGMLLRDGDQTHLIAMTELLE